MTQKEKLVEELEFMTKDDGSECLECIADFILADRKRIVEKVIEYTHHESSCLCSQFRSGRPTTDGNYETLYGHGNKEKWYKRGEYPICSCGLRELIDEIKQEQV